MAACSTGQSNPTHVRSFDEIAVDAPKVEVDPSGTYATLKVTTSIDAVCAVSYGQDDSLGSLATDQDMGAAGHDDHTAVMTGLTPGTEYKYSLQGIGPEGTLYQSEVFSFTTPDVEDDAFPGVNVAPQATIVDVSSEFSDSFAAELAIDGDIGTEWSTNGDGDDAYIVIDLGSPAEVVGVGFRSRSMTDGSSIANSFTVTAGDGEPLGPFPAGPGLAIADVRFVGRILRIDVNESTGGNTGAIEIEVYSAH